MTTKMTSSLGNLIILLVSLLFAQASYARGPIPSAPIQQIGNINRVNGLDWLDLNETRELTVAQALAKFPDFRVAKESEVRAMFGLFATFNDGYVMHYLATESGATFDRVLLDTVYYDYIPDFDPFIDIFGKTLDSVRSIDEFQVASLGIYKKDQFANRYGVVGTYMNSFREFGPFLTHDEYSAFNIDATDQALGTTPPTYDEGDPRFQTTMGIFLVQDTPTVTSVPEPSSLILMALGLLTLMGVSARRVSRRKS